MLWKDMELASHDRSKWLEPVKHCLQCGHLESEHGKTGTRPCLAVIGNGVDRQFCPCDELKTSAARGIFTVGLNAA
jgi:hypothetical protein